MPTTDLIAWVVDTQGNKVPGATFSTDHHGIRASRKANGLGRFAMHVDPGYYQLIQPDYLVNIDLRFEDGSLKPFRSYFARKFRFRGQGDHGEDVVMTVGGPDLNYVITSRIVNAAKGSASASMTDEADDLVKELLRDQLGSDAVAARDLSSFFDVEANKADLASISREMSWQEVWDVVQGIAKDTASGGGTRLFWDVTKTGSYAFKFQTYAGLIGVDRTSAGHVIQQQYFGTERKNISNPDLELNYESEVTYVYGLPKGSGSNRTPVEVNDATRERRSPIARREAVVEVNSTNTDEITSEANERLEQGRPRLDFSVDILNTVSFRYGVHWDFGDLVQVRWGGAPGARLGVYEGIVDYVEIGKAPDREGGFEEIFAASVEAHDALR